MSGQVRKKRNDRIKLRDRFRCQMCGKLRLANDLEVDHRIPLSEGGSEDDSNLQSLCADPCHRNKTTQEAARSMGRGGVMNFSSHPSSTGATLICTKNRHSGGSA